MAKQFFDLTTTQDNKTRIDHHEDVLQSYNGKWWLLVISKGNGICIGKKPRSYGEQAEEAARHIGFNGSGGIVWYISNITFPPHDIIDAFPIPAKD